jgi:hypothetical protein
MPNTINPKSPLPTFGAVKQYTAWKGRGGHSDVCDATLPAGFKNRVEQFARTHTKDQVLTPEEYLGFFGYREKLEEEFKKYLKGAFNEAVSVPD